MIHHAVEIHFRVNRRTSSRCRSFSVASLRFCLALGVSFLVANGCSAKKTGMVAHQFVSSSIPCNESSVDEDGRLEWCEISRDAEIQGHLFPAKTRLEFDENGNLDCCFLNRNTELEGRVYRGKGHAFQTCFHPNGRLRFGNLENPEVIQGIPCEKSNFWIWTFKGKAGVYFHDNGQLESCLLAEDLELQGHHFKKGNHIHLDRNGKVTAAHKP